MIAAIIAKKSIDNGPFAIVSTPNAMLATSKQFIKTTPRI